VVKLTKDKFDKTIGILGTGGPWAAAKAHRVLLRLAQKHLHARADDDYPRIIVHSAALMGMDSKGVASADLASFALKSVVQNIFDAGADIVVKACNSTYALHPALAETGEKKLVNIVESGAAQAKARGFKKLGILCSQSAKDGQLHARALQRFGLAAVYPLADDQDIVNQIIESVMAGDENVADKLAAVCVALKNMDVDAIMVGCTEISCVAHLIPSKIAVIDCLTAGLEQALFLAQAKEQETHARL
jgi:aspartate racemase